MRRRYLAIVACLLWLAGVELLPALHQGFHAGSAPHTHAANGLVLTVSYGGSVHRHADGVEHSHGEPIAKYGPVVPRHDGKSRLEADSDHAAGLAHHALALIAAPPPITQPVPVDRSIVFVEPASVRALASATVPEAAARGPPVSES